MPDQAYILIASSVGPGKEYVRHLLPGVLVNLARACSQPCELLTTFDGIEPFEVPGSAQRLSAVDHLTIDGRLARMRESQRKYFLSRRFTHLYWHDSDMVPPVGIIDHLLALGAPIASGIYNLRGDNEGKMPIRMLPESAGCTPPSADETISIPVDGTLIYPHAAGMGCMLVAREVLQKTPFRCPESYQGREWGEDIRWCLDTGHKVAVDISQSCWHIDASGVGTRPTWAERQPQRTTEAQQPAKTRRKR